MNTANSQSQEAIRETIEAWTRAVRAKDIDAIMAHYAADCRDFDAVAQLQFRGREAYKAHWQACMEFCQGPHTFEPHELEIAAAEDLAFSHFLTHCGGTNEQGEQQSGWLRTTLCMRRIDGQWLIVHDHFSVPFDMKSGELLFNLQP